MKTLALAALAAMIAFACPASAANLDNHGCAPFADALRFIMDKNGEAPAFLAIHGSAVLTITVNEKTGTFTVWAQRTPEIMCAVDAGEGWEPAPDAVKQIAPAGKPS